MKKNKFSSKNKSYPGFSLLEMLISMFIFTLIIITSVSIFARVASTRQKTREIQKNMEEARTALDLMAKNMRMSIGLNNNIPGNDQRIYMLNASQGECICYIFYENKLKMSQVDVPPANANLSDNLKCKPVTGTLNYWTDGTKFQNIMENDVTGRFIVTPTSASLNDVGKATIVLKVDGINLQTTVSFRDYNNIIQ